MRSKRLMVDDAVCYQRGLVATVGGVKVSAMTRRQLVAAIDIIDGGATHIGRERQRSEEALVTIFMRMLQERDERIARLEGERSGR